MIALLRVKICCDCSMSRFPLLGSFKRASGYKCLTLAIHMLGQSRPSTHLQTLDVIFYGDSITESWRGLQVGVPMEKFKGIPEIFAKAYGGVRAAVYSIAGKTHLYHTRQ